MKRLFSLWALRLALAFLVSLHFVHAQDPCDLQPWEPLPPPVRTNGINAKLDFDADGSPDVAYSIGSDDVSRTFYSLENWPHAAFMAATPTRVRFLPSELIGPAAKVPYTSPGNPAGVTLLFQTWVDECAPFGCYNYGAALGDFHNDSEAIVGVRVTSENGPHYGWVKFVRPCTKPWVPFTLDSYALHPLPNTPIPAGVVPQPELTITREGEQVTLSWPAGWQGWQLEWQPVLKPSVAWKPVEGVQNNSVTLPADWPAAFFRLVKPAP